MNNQHVTVSVALLAAAVTTILVWSAGLLGLQEPPQNVRDAFTLILIVLLAWIIFDRKVDGKVNLGPDVEGPKQ